MFNSQLIFKNQGANLASGSFLVAGWNTIVMNVTISGTSTGNALSLRFPCSTKYSVRLEDTKPDFTSSASVTNPWTYAFFTDSNSGVNYQGSTGVVFDGGSTGLDNGIYQFVLESPGTSVGFVWVGAEVFSWAAGMATVEVTQSVLTTA